MAVTFNPYLNFKDNAREALTFYQSVFGGELDVRTFKELNASRGPDDENLVMHGQLEAGNGITLMAADTPPSMQYSAPAGFSISLSGDDEATIRGYWDKLAAGATIGMPLEKAIWGDTFGMLTDRFGVGWVVNISGQPG